MKKFFLKSSIALATLTLCSGAFASQYPNLPEVIAGSETGALVGDTLYVGLGSKSDLFYSLNLKDKNAKWEAIPAFPGGARNQAVAAGVDGKLYVFGGFQNTDIADNQTAKDAYSYNPADKKWEKLTTRSPFGPSAGTSVTTYKDKIYFFGGVNQNIWDGLFQDAKAAGEEKGKVFDKYFDMSAEDFLFNPIVTSYEPKTNHWANQGYFPYGGRAGAAFAVVDGKFVVANGELKAGLRTDTTEIGTLGKKGIEWKAMQKLPAPTGDKSQEGIAAVMSGISHGTYLVTGGANFPGVAENYAKGVNDHRKAKANKTFRSEVYALDMKTGVWKIVGNLPVGTAGAVSVTYDDKVIIAGGKTTGNKALTDVKTMSYDGKVLTIE
ncbi:N-acetylneuraminate epimerase precursor [Phocoenobacter uteri]|uniref:N-acetylneuraminate epimerase n=1 Tax=Phocoenobacter uteri TaxID=146806 RepID=A0A379C6P6_9PAST|nr:YjhT family mutarotase [Phocoenobacter uteri]MDG6881914.1 N-acetylneuraminic acid mutarotase [Phocoenobacter uteri]SUB58062.1 N-acetylneuraminate epimerase precursor [Phocoenobacter uteri]